MPQTTLINILIIFYTDLEASKRENEIPQEILKAATKAPYYILQKFKTKLIQQTTFKRDIPKKMYAKPILLVALQKVKHFRVERHIPLQISNFTIIGTFNVNITK